MSDAENITDEMIDELQTYGEVIDELQGRLVDALENWRALRAVMQMYLDKIIEVEKDKLRLKEENAELRKNFIKIRDKLEKLEKQSCH